MLFIGDNGLGRHGLNVLGSIGETHEVPVCDCFGSIWANKCAKSVRDIVNGIVCIFICSNKGCTTLIKTLPTELFIKQAVSLDIGSAARSELRAQSFVFAERWKLQVSRGDDVVLET